MIGDIERAHALIDLDMDTSGVERKAEGAAQKLRKMGDAAVDGAKGMNAGLNDVMEKLGKFNQAFEGAQKIVGFAADAMKTYAEQSRLSAAASGVSITQLREASKGLRSEMELLSDAAKFNHGAFKLTQEQMNTAERAMVALTRAGFDQAEVHRKVTDAIVKGSGKALDDFGIIVKDGKTDLEKFNNLMSVLAIKAGDVDKTTGGAAESVDRMGVEYRNAMDKIKAAVGDLVVQLAPLIAGLAKAVGYVADLVPQVEGIFNPAKAMGRQAKLAYEVGQSQRALGFLSAQSGIDDFARQQGQRESVDARVAFGGLDQIIAFGENYKPLSDADKAKLAEAALNRAALAILHSAATESGRNFTDTARKPIGFSLGTAADTTIYNEYGVAQGEQDIVNRLETQRTAGLTADWMQRVGARQQRKQNFLESNFGKIEEFKAYAVAFGTLNVAVQSSMQAWINGSLTLGQAIKKGLGDALAGLASSMAVESLKHGAYAIGSLAFGDFAGAARHGAASAAFGAGAVAAAVAARKLGASGAGESASTGGGAGASAGGGSRSSNPGAGNGQGQGMTQYVIVYGENFYRQSNRMRGPDAARFARAAVGSSYAENH